MTYSINENHGDQQGIFFVEYKDSKRSFKELSRIFHAYLPYFQESLWLLEQKFLANYAKKANKDQEDLFHELLKKHRQDLSEGLQSPLMETLVQSHFFSAPQSKEILEKIGKGFFSCSKCNVHFQSMLSLSGSVQKCSYCGSILEESRFDKSSLWDSFQNSFYSPRLVSSLKIESPFLFLDIEESNSLSLLEMEEEIQLVLQSLDFWIESLESAFSLAKSEKLSSQKRNLAITRAISKRLFQESSFEQKGEEKQLSYVPVFSGYLENLYELFWYFSQKIFMEFVQIKGYVSENQATNSWKEQIQLFHSGETLHIAEILERKGFLEENQISEILKDMGYSLRHCHDCSLMYEGFSYYKKKFYCCSCHNELEENAFESKWFLLLRHIFFNLPVPMGIEKEYSPFEFFKNNKEYKPSFELSQQQVTTAWKNFGKEKEGDFSFTLEEPEDSLSISDVLSTLSKKEIVKKEEKEESQDIFGIAELSQELKAISEKEETIKKEPKAEPQKTKVKAQDNFDEDILGVSQEVDLLMNSIAQTGKMTSDEAIYDRYTRREAKKEVKPTENAIQAMKGVHEEKKYVEQIETLSPPKKKSKKTMLSVFMPYENLPAKNSIPIWPILLIVFFTSGFLWFFYSIIFHKNSEVIVAKKIEETKPILPTPPKQNPVEPEVPSKPKEEKKPEDVPKENWENIKQPENTISSLPETELKKFLDLYPEEDRISSTLITLVNNQKLLEEDIALLQKIYQDYPDNLQLRSLCIWAAGCIKSEKTREWILKLLSQTNSSMEKISIIEALEKFRDNKSKEDILEIFKQETQENVMIACVTALVKLGPDDENIYQKLTNKFYETDSHGLRSLILLVVANMKINNVSLFLGDILKNASYNIDLRFQALEAMNNHARNNHEEKNVLLILQNILPMVSDERIKEAILASLEDLSHQ